MDTDGRREDSGRGVRRYRRDDPGSNSGRREVGGGLQALWGAPMAAYSDCGERDGGIGHGKRRSRTGLARVCGDVGLAGGSVADGRRQAGSGMARSREDRIMLSTSNLPQMDAVLITTFVLPNTSETGSVGGFGENPFPKPWHEVEQLITQAVQEDIQDNLGQADLRPIDLYLSAFGPALRVISEHWGTERESNNPDRQETPFLVTPTDALQVARREVSRHRAQEISREWANNPMDAATKFYVLAKDATENDTLLFDEANLLARAIGVRLEKNDSDMKRVVGFKADKVSLLSARDRLAARNIGEDINPGSTLDTVHMAIALTDRRNTLDAQQWLTQHLHDPQEAQFRATLEALIRTTKPGHDDYPAQRNLWQSLYGEEAPQPAVAQPALL